VRRIISRVGFVVCPIQTENLFYLEAFSGTLITDFLPLNQCVEGY